MGTAAPLKSLQGAPVSVRVKREGSGGIGDRRPERLAAGAEMEPGEGVINYFSRMMVAEK